MTAATNRYRNRHFLGCFPIDKLPKNIHRSSMFVQNSERHDESGGHWVLIDTAASNRVCFYDSFAQSTKSYSKRLHKKLYSLDPAYWQSRRAVQYIASNACGFHVIFFACLRMQGLHCNKIVLTVFSEDFSNNDTIAKRYVQRQFYPI